MTRKKQPKKPSNVLDRMVGAFDRTLLDVLEHGEVATKQGEPIIDEKTNKPIRVPPSAAFLNVARHRIQQLQQSRGMADETREAAEEALARAARDRGEIPPLDLEGDDPATL